MKRIRYTDKQRLDWLSTGRYGVCETLTGARKFFVWNDDMKTPKYFNTVRLAIDAAIRAEARDK